MTVGTILLSANYKGTSYEQGGGAFFLCNGQTVLRSEYTDLSNLWPVGTFGSTAINIIIPDLSDGYYFRGSDFGRGADPDQASRTALSGSGPFGTAIGSVQTANMRIHTHANGTQPGRNRSQTGGDPNGSYPYQGRINQPTETMSRGNSQIAEGAALNSAFDVFHMKMYPYLLARF